MISNHIRHDRIKALDAMTDYSKLPNYFLMPLAISRKYEDWEKVLYFAEQGEPIEMYKKDWKDLLQQLTHNITG